MKRFNKIMCVVDSEKTMTTALTQAVRIAQDHQADITFISVLKQASAWRKSFFSREQWGEIHNEFIAKKRSAIEHKLLSIAPSLKADILVTSGIGFIEIIKHAVRGQYDLVVKCAEDVDWMDRMLGSEDMHLLRKCPYPVLMLKPEHKDSFRNVLATVDINDDFSELDENRVQEQLNERVLEYSAALSIAELSELHIGGVWDAYAEDLLRHGAFSSTPDDKVDQYVEQTRLACSSRLEILVKKMATMLGKATVQYLQPRPHLVKGTASKEIPLMVETYGIDLIVMGTVGRAGITGFIIGNTAESILEQTQCSILAIKPDGFKTPIE
ncbi:MAG TPA: universal stress protein [Marinagarivorans sp.]